MAIENAFEIITTLVTNFDVVLHQMNVKTIFLNGVLSTLKDSMNKSINRLKQAFLSGILSMKYIWFNGDKFDECI